MTGCIFNWSGGKDSALALYYCLQDPQLDIRYLVTTVNDSVDRISMHGVRTTLLMEQARSIGIPLYQIRLPEMPGMTEYDEIMKMHLQKFYSEGISHAIYGDIFLEDLKDYRDKKLAEVNMTGIYPLWKRDTHKLINEFLELGFGTVIACAQEGLKYLVGKEMSADLVRSFPAEVDPCGENGEFHTFAFKGPIFSEIIRYSTGEKVFKEYTLPINSDDTCVLTTPQKLLGIWYIDLLPNQGF